MPTGTVKWFNNAKGYGFILPEGGGDDLFVHYSSIAMDGYKTLKAGQSVEYETRAGDKGEHATAVRANEAEAAPAATPIRREHPVAENGRAGVIARVRSPTGGSADSIAAAMLSSAHDE